MMNYPYNQDYINMMNPQDKMRLFQSFGNYNPSQSQLNNNALLSSYARNLVRNYRPEDYMYVQQFLNQIYGR